MSCYFIHVSLLNMSCGECDVISLYFICCSYNSSVCLVVAYLRVFVNCL